MSTQSASTSEVPAPAGTSGADHLVRYFMSLGFAPSRFPETDPIARECDLVLSGTIKRAVGIICIVDRDRHPNAQFTYPIDALAAIGEQCLKHAGRTRRVRIHVIEIGADIDRPPVRAHLQSYVGAFADSAVLVHAWAIDTASNTVWTNADAIDRFLPLEAINSVLRTPHATDAEAADAAEVWRVAQASGQAPVWLTYALLAALVLAYFVEITGAKTFSPSAGDLAAAGGLSLNLVRSGQWFRIVTAPFLHGGPIHLAMNAIVLFYAGKLLERTIGTTWFAVVYLVAGLGGALGSLLINPANTVTVGASGALMGVVAALGICSFHFPYGPLRTSMRAMALNVLIPSLLPVFNAVGGGAHIDIAAHVGGALAGAIVAGMVVAVWPPTDLLPRYRWLAAGIAALGLVALGMTLTVASRQLGAAVELIPEADVPITEVGRRYQGAKLAARYPHDPRARLFHAFALMDAGDLAGAESELRAGLAEKDVLRYALTPNVEMILRANLAAVLQQRGNTQEARATAAPVCWSVAPDLAPVRQALTSRKLCE